MTEHATPQKPPIPDLTDATTLARMLGITRHTVLKHRANGATWLPEAQMVLGKWAWLTDDLSPEKIEAMKEHRQLYVGPGNPNWRRTTPPATEPASTEQTLDEAARADQDLGEAPSTPAHGFPPEVIAAVAEEPAPEGDGFWVDLSAE